MVDRSSNARVVIAAAVAAALLAGCATPSTPARETAPTLPTRFESGEAVTPESSPASSNSAATVPRDWWTLFADPALDALIREAHAANPDLVAAAARVAEARAIAGVSRADRLPTLGVEASATRAQTSERASYPGAPASLNDTFRAGGTVSYELDLWGRYARANAADRQRLVAAEWNASAVRLSLEAEVARSTFTARAAIGQFDVAARTVDDRRDAVELETLRTRAGEGSELSQRQAEAELESAQVTKFRAALARDDSLRALGVLLGRAPVELDPARLTSIVGSLDLPAAPNVPAGLPSTVLERRPDLLEAEAALAAARFDVGAARAALFPSISLTGRYGNESFELSDLFKSGASAWSVAGLLTQPIFEGGRRRAAIGRANAQTEQRFAEYQKAVIVAFREVFDALQAQRALGEVRDARTRQIAALGRTVELAELRYDEGHSSYLDLLDARRNLLTAQLDLVDSERAQLTAAVDLILALGGGA